MSEKCENILRVTAFSPDGEVQLKNFITKSKINNETFDIEGTFPFPMTKDEAISWSSMMSAGLAIFKHRSGDSSELEKYLKYPWVISAGIKELSRLEPFLIDSGAADVNLGQIASGNLLKYGYATEHDWKEAHWGTIGSYDSKEQYTQNDIICVTFFTKNGPPDRWLKTISSDFPKLHFNLVWEVPFCNGGAIDALNGDIVIYNDKFPGFEEFFEAEQ